MEKNSIIARIEYLEKRLALTLGNDPMSISRRRLIRKELKELKKILED